MGMRLQDNFEWTCEGSPKLKKSRRLRGSDRYQRVYMIVYKSVGGFFVNLGGITEVLKLLSLFSGIEAFFVPKANFTNKFI